MNVYRIISKIIKNIAAQSKKKITKELHTTIRHILDTNDYVIFDSPLNSFIITKNIELPFAQYTDLLSLTSLDDSTIEHLHGFINTLISNDKYLKCMCQSSILLVFEFKQNNLYLIAKSKKIPIQEYHKFLQELQQYNYINGVTFAPRDINNAQMLNNIIKILSSNEAINETFDLIRIAPKITSFNNYNISLRVRYNSLDELYCNIDNVIKQIKLVQKYSKTIETRVFNLKHFIPSLFPVDYTNFDKMERAVELLSIITRIADSILINHHLDNNCVIELYRFVYYVKNSVIKYGISDLKSILSNYIIETAI